MKLLYRNVYLLDGKLVRSYTRCSQRSLRLTRYAWLPFLGVETVCGYVIVFFEPARAS